MILVSNGGSNILSTPNQPQTMVVGTIDGAFLLERRNGEWQIINHALPGCSVSAVTASTTSLFAATHGVGVARSDDGGRSWDWCNKGLTQFDLWSARVGLLQGREAVFVGSMPAHLYVSEDNGETWRDLPALTAVPSAAAWCFPPPPRLGHVKDIVIDGNRLFVGIEIGALLVSEDFGQSFIDLHVESDPTENDIHRVLVSPKNRNALIASVGLVGLVRSDDGGMSWERIPVIEGMEYPDPLVMHPTQPNTLFMAVGVGWPPRWYESGRAQGKIARSDDSGLTWKRLLGGLPNGQRALFGGLSLAAWEGGFGLYAADSDGQVFESLDGGEYWTMIADIAPVSKGEFHRGLAKNRRKLATVNDMVVSGAAAKRFATAGSLTAEVSSGRTSL